MSDLNKRLAALSPQKRALFEEALKNKQSRLLARSAKKEAFAIPDEYETYDVVILGGGLAGLTLALQIKQTRPETSILVIEKRKHPVPEAAFKVGESIVEVGSHYLSNILGLKDHLQSEQLPKFGLRFFFSAAGNDNIAKRPEIGATFFPPVPSYQLDRGRFENMLGRRIQEKGILFWDGCKVEQVHFDRPLHFMRVNWGDTQTEIATRWLVDASGRAGYLRRQLRLEQELPHKINAAWFRVDKRIDIEDWSDNSQWRSYVPPGQRWLSTVLLLGHGYWVWLIPLASGGTSVGIVTDATIYPYHDINRRERALEWLQKYEPQCARMVEPFFDELLDFRALKNCAHGCKQVFSGDGWCLTGEAGAFLDPLYSPGTDFIALSNTSVTDILIHALDGEDVQERARLLNQNYLNGFDIYLSTFNQQYALMANRMVMTTKIIWDFGTYWAFIALLFFQGKFCDANFLASVAGVMSRYALLHARMQQFFREWNALEEETDAYAYVDALSLDFLYRLDEQLIAETSEEELKARLADNMALFEQFAVAIFHKAARNLPETRSTNRINPYAISLKPERWEAEGLFQAAEEITVSESFKEDLKKIWRELPLPVGMESTPTFS